MDIILKEKWRC